MKHKRDVLAPGEVTVVVPQGMDCRSLSNRVAPWDKPKMGQVGDAAQRACLDALLSGTGVLNIPTDQMLQQAQRSQQMGLQGCQFIGGQTLENLGGFPASWRGAWLR